MIWVFASLLMGCCVGLCVRREPESEVPLWTVRGWMYQGDWPGQMMPYEVEFVADSREDACRQYGDHVRSLGYWVGGIAYVWYPTQQTENA